MSVQETSLETRLGLFSDEDLASFYRWLDSGLYYHHEYGFEEIMAFYEEFALVVEDEICKRFCRSHLVE